VKRLAAAAGSRFIRWGRRLLGAGLLAWSAWTILRPLVKRIADPRTVSRGRGAHDELYELRTRPLSPAEWADATIREREETRDAWETWTIDPTGERGIRGQVS
jgi:hypothetical protein